MEIINEVNEREDELEGVTPPPFHYKSHLPILVFPTWYNFDFITSKTPLTMKHWLIPRYVLPDFIWPDNVRLALSDQISSTLFAGGFWRGLDMYVINHVIL